MDILVVGGNSFIGSNLCSYLLGRMKDISIINMDTMRDTRMEEIIGINAYQGRYSFKEGDITRLATYEHYLKVADLVINCASESYHPHFNEGMERYVMRNIMGARMLADSACRSKVPLLHMSTDEVYGSCPFTVQRREETAPIDPTNSFSTTMAAGERLVSIAGKKSGNPIAIIRPCEIIGPNQSVEMMIPRTIRSIMTQRPPQIREKGGERYRDWLHIYDLCSALEIVIESLLGSSTPISSDHESGSIIHPGSTVISGTSVGTASPTQTERSSKRSILSGVSIFNITAEMRHPIADIIHRTMEIMGSELPLQETTEEGYKDIGYNPSGKKIMYQGWQARYTEIDEVLRSTVEWYRENSDIIMEPASGRLMP